MIQYSDDELSQLNAELEGADAAQILTWAWGAFGPQVVASSSFQTQSLPLLHMIARTVPEMPVFFLDTGFHFPETLAYRDRLVRSLGVNVCNLTPTLGHDGFRQKYGLLYRTDPDRCCYLNKVEPLRQALLGLGAWVTGIRRDQTATRAAALPIERDTGGVLRVAPMLGWTAADVEAYIAKHQLPVHPLLSQGYLSVGCAPCTRAVRAGEGERAGRWAGTTKRECGLHNRPQAKP